MQYINFPLLLVVLVAASGLIWLIDSLFFRKTRAGVLQQLQKEWPSWSEPDSRDREKFLVAAQERAAEPVLVEYSRSLFPVLAIVLVLRSFIVEPFQIPSGSMLPTLRSGDFILVNKFTYGLRLPVVRTKVTPGNEPQRGDVMVFFPPNIKQYYIKRVVGVPGDLIEYSNKVLIINGVPQPQTLLAELPACPPSFATTAAAARRLIEETLNGVVHESFQCTERNQLEDFSIQVRPGHFFMMGDNRDDSSDSRVWGQVPEANIVGRAFAIWMHWDNFWSLPSFSRTGGFD